jgi:hypothetical protein
MFRFAAIALLAVCLLPAATAPKPERPSKWKKIVSAIAGDTKKGMAIRFAMGFAATAATLSFRPAPGPLPRTATPSGPIITPGQTSFGCAGCVGPDWSKGKP